ncbi:MAG: hypothetical protein ACT4NX_09450 [Deltaproteobacteria bacterium]
MAEPGKSLSEILAEIQSDSASGAAELTRRASEVYIALAEGRIGGGTAADFLGGVHSFSEELVKCHSSMAPILNLANDILLAAEDSSGENEAREGIRFTARSWVRKIEANGKSVALHCSEALASVSRAPTILTHSYSSTVLRAITQARALGLNPTVICTESRPAFEGAAMARKLADESIKVIYLPDMVAFSMIQSKGVDAVLVGADAVSTEGLVNKAGTLGLAVFAHEFGTAVFALLGSEKFLSAGLMPAFKINEHPAEKVLANRDARLEIVNRYFDLTPLCYITGFITEGGALDSKDLLQRIKNSRISARIAGMRHTDSGYRTEETPR